MKEIDEKVKVDTLIKVERDRVYDALTTGEGMDAWFTKGAEIDARHGGKILFRWKNWGVENYTGETGGPVLQAKPPERFTFQWPADSGLYNSTVEISLEEVQEGTIVRLREFGFEDTPTGLRDMLNRATGWGEAVTLLKFYLEHGVTC